MAMKNQLQNLISGGELAVLLTLKNKHSDSEETTPVVEISEIVSQSGIEDSEEVLRALYSLEGKSLVRPDPDGDFTSIHWKITEYGTRAIEIIHS